MHCQDVGRVGHGTRRFAKRMTARFSGKVRSYCKLSVVIASKSSPNGAQASLHLLLSADSYTLLLIPTLIEICVLRLEQTRSTNTSTSTSSYSFTVLSIAYSPPLSFRPWQFTGSIFSVYSPFICLTSTASPPVAKHWHAAPREVLATHHHVGS